MVVSRVLRVLAKPSGRGSYQEVPKLPVGVFPGREFVSPNEARMPGGHGNGLAGHADTEIGCGQCTVGPSEAAFGLGS